VITISSHLRSISTQKNFPQKENFVKCDWPTQIFRRKKILKLKFSTFNNDIFGTFSVRGNFSLVEMGLYTHAVMEKSEIS
jgi:hypothetical protein